MSGLHRVTRRRALSVLGLVVFSASVIVSFAEFRKPPPKRAGYTSGDAVAPAQGQHALDYTELRHTQRGPARDVYRESMETLRARLPALTEPLVRTPGERDQMLASRAARRAYDGAPPTVPHPVDERASPNCVVCHEHGAMVGTLRAPAMSHAMLSSCLQCHVPELKVHASPVASTLVGSGNSFEPIPFGGVGTRAWPGAPPTRPHTLAMRTRCSSCHGVAGHPGLRTSHPERQNCEQCHAGIDGNESVNLAMARRGGTL